MPELLPASLHSEFCRVKRLKVTGTKTGGQLNWLFYSLLCQHPQTWVEWAESGRNVDLDTGASS